MSLREQTFLAWITTAGVVLGFALRTGQVVDLTALKIIPVLSLPFAVVIYRHHKIIDRIATYINTELVSFLRQDDDRAPRHWDDCHTVKMEIPNFLRLEVLVHLVLLTGLPIICLLYVFHEGGQAMWGDSFTMAGLLFTAVVIIFGVIEFANTR